MGGAMLVVFLIFAIAVYIFFCYCLKLICEKCGHEPGVLIWIPILMLIPLLKVAGMATWMILLFFIPVVGAIVGIYMWVKICQARQKSGWLVLLMFVPLVGVFVIPYLAFAGPDAPAQPAEPAQ